MNVTEKLKFLNDLGYEVVSDNLGNNLEVKCKNGHVFIKELGYEIVSDNLGPDLRKESEKMGIYLSEHLIILRTICQRNERINDYVKNELDFY
ncbi:hypothetical protein [Campylobacter phage CJLB-10]|nr:hypothetical protein [Campylobacter phage CJLB-10]